MKSCESACGIVCNLVQRTGAPSFAGAYGAGMAVSLWLTGWILIELAGGCASSQRHSLIKIKNTTR